MWEVQLVIPLTVIQGSTLSLTNVITYPYCFLTANKMTSHPSVLAGTSDSKNPDPYYSVLSVIITIVRKFY